MNKPLNDSVIHWEENLLKAKQGTLVLDDITGDRCALCSDAERQAYDARRKDKEIYVSMCNYCPLAKAGHKCEEFELPNVVKPSPWEKVYDAIVTDGVDPTEATELMLHTLKELKDDS